MSSGSLSERVHCVSHCCLLTKWIAGTVPHCGGEQHFLSKGGGGGLPKIHPQSHSWQKLCCLFFLQTSLTSFCLVSQRRRHSRASAECRHASLLTKSLVDNTKTSFSVDIKTRTQEFKRKRNESNGGFFCVSNSASTESTCHLFSWGLLWLKCDQDNDEEDSYNTAVPGLKSHWWWADTCVCDSWWVTETLNRRTRTCDNTFTCKAESAIQVHFKISSKSPMQVCYYSAVFIPPNVAVSVKLPNQKILTGSQNWHCSEP